MDTIVSQLGDQSRQSRLGRQTQELWFEIAAIDKTQNRGPVAEKISAM